MEAQPTEAQPVEAQPTEAQPEVAEDVPQIVVKTMAGREVFRCDAVETHTVLDLKTLIAESGYMAVVLQKLLHENGFAVCSDGEVLEAKSQGFLLVQDDTPLWYWDLENNPSRRQLRIEGPVVKCQGLKTDYTNVLTRAPISAGLHYFEFHLHHYGDEQWCGLTPDPDMAGPERSKAIPSKTGWNYYTGRGKGAIEALGHHLKACQFANRHNSVIGMLVDCDAGAVAFALDGETQGACEIPRNTPLWVITHLDAEKDHVELRKPCLEDSAPANFEALKGALLNVSKGEKMLRTY